MRRGYAPAGPYVCPSKCRRESRALQAASGAEAAPSGCLATRQALAESYGRYRALAGATFDALIIHDQGTILEVNEAFETLTGLSREHWLGQSVFAFLSETLPPELQKSLRTPLVSFEEEAGPYEIDLRNRAGKGVILETWVKAMPYQGRWVRVVAFRDVTEHRKLEQAKREFVSVISHELRSPLSSLNTSLEILAREGVGEVSPRAERMLEAALQASKHLLRLANQTLDYERLSSGYLALTLSDCSVSGLLWQAVETMRGAAEASGIALIVEPDPAGTDSILSVRADADRIVQVLVNLLGNALKFAPSGSTIHLRAQRSAQGVRFEIHDQGPGIPSEHQQVVFEHFKQLETTPAQGGVGLGLPICRELIALHHGTIGVESRPGGGCTFYFTLPSP